MGKTSLRIMSLNVENLFSPGNQFYGSEYEPDKYQDKVNWIGYLIGRAQVHVTTLIEIGEDSEKCVKDVMDAANKHGGLGGRLFEHEFRAEPCKGSTKIRTAVISRFPLADTESLSKYPDGFNVDLHKPGTDDKDEANWITVPSTGFSRPIAKVSVNPPNGATPFNLFVVHLKSKRPSKAKHDNYNEAIGIARAAIQRNVEAAGLRYYFDSFLPEQYQADNKLPTFVVGDFNDTPTSVPVENLRGSFDKVPGPSKPWSEPDKRRLISCARLHLKKAAYDDKLFSYVHNENFSLIDQALVTEHLPGRFKRMEIYNDHVFRHQDMSSKTEQEQQWKSQVSDHGAVAIEFTRMLK
jgi:predicted extracellular nuclease